MQNKKSSAGKLRISAMKKMMLTLILGVLMLPMAVSAATSWGLGFDSSGISFGISSGPSAGSYFGGGYGGGGWVLSNPYGLPQGSIMGIITNLLFWLLTLFAVLGIIAFILAGIFYLTAAGEESQMEKGKETMKWAIMGIIIGLSGFVIMQAAASLLGGMSKSF